MYNNRQNATATRNVQTSDRSCQTDMPSQHACSDSGLVEHHTQINAARAGDKYFKCYLCRHKTANRSDFTRHVLTHATQRRLRCRFCPCVTTSRRYLYEHMKVMHFSGKRFMCGMCLYKTQCERKYSKHFELHLEQNAWKCAYCDFKNACRDRLKRHVRRHVGEKCLQCNVCGFQTLLKAYLRLHVMSHASKKQYKCKICCYKSTCVASINIHVKTHMGEKQHNCTFCPYKTATKSCLTVHMKTHGGEE